MLSTNIVVGNRFHSVTLADTLHRLGLSCQIYTSLPARRFQSPTADHHTKFVPLISSIVRKLTGWDTRSQTEYEVALFDYLTCLRLSRAPVLYGWAGYSLVCGSRAKKAGGAYFLERSCPHIDFQERLIEREADRLEVAYQPKPKFWRLRSLREYEICDQIVVPSHYSRKSFLDRGYPKDKVFVAPLDRPTLSPQRVPFPKQFVVGVVGGNILRKGFQYLFKAWQSLNIPGGQLLVRASEKELRQSPVLDHFLNNCPSIKVVPPVSKMEDFYHRCTVICLPSVDDGFGLAPFEAISCSRPVVITEHVGAKDVLEGTGAANIVEEANADSLAQALEELYQNSDLRECMAASAYALAVELDQADRYTASIRELYFNRLPRLLSKRGIWSPPEALLASS